MPDSVSQRGGYDVAQEVTGLARGTLHSMVSRGQIPHTRLGPRLVIFDRDELQDWMAQRHAELQEARAEQGRAVMAPPPPAPRAGVVEFRGFRKKRQGR
ncbi:MAG: helix-turn-helix domain-containing protein [Myxococcota bacterium]